jgi:hypothetical protein
VSDVLVILNLRAVARRAEHNLVEGKLIPSGCPADPEAYGSLLVVERDDCVGAWQIRVGTSSLGLVGRLDASPDNANVRSVYLAAGLRSSCGADDHMS